MYSIFQFCSNTDNSTYFCWGGFWQSPPTHCKSVKSAGFIYIWSPPHPISPSYPLLGATHIPPLILHYIFSSNTEAGKGDRHSGKFSGLCNFLHMGNVVDKNYFRFSRKYWRKKYENCNFSHIFQWIFNLRYMGRIGGISWCKKQLLSRKKILTFKTVCGCNNYCL